MVRREVSYEGGEAINFLVSRDKKTRNIIHSFCANNIMDSYLAYRCDRSPRRLKDTMRTVGDRESSEKQCNISCMYEECRSVNVLRLERR